MSAVGSLTVRVEVETHGAITDTRIGVVKRTLALWSLSFAQWLLKSRIDVSFKEGA